MSLLMDWPLLEGIYISRMKLHVQQEEKLRRMTRKPTIFFYLSFKRGSPVGHFVAAFMRRQLLFKQTHI